MDAEKKLVTSIGADIKIEQVRINNYIINYAAAGSGRPLLLIHGANIGWGQWYPNIAELSKHFTVYAIDLPGAGGSTKIDFKTADLEKDFVDIVDAFIINRGLDNISLLGHSLGGWVALKLAIKNKPYIEKIILVDSLGFTDYVPPKHRLSAFYPFAKLLSRTVMKPTKEKMAKFSEEMMHKNTENISEEFLEYLCESITRERITHPLLLINRLTNFRKMVPELVVIDELPKITNKTLIIIGDNDPLIPLNKVKDSFALIPNSQVAVFGDVGHLPFVEESTKFNERVINFLNS